MDEWMGCVWGYWEYLCLGGLLEHDIYCTCQISIQVIHNPMSKRAHKHSLNLHMTPKPQPTMSSQKSIHPDFHPFQMPPPPTPISNLSTSSPELATNLQIVTSKPYQDLVSKLRSLKAQKDAIIQQLKLEKKNRKAEMKNLYKDKTKVKMDIWEKIGRICKLKDEIATERERSQMLDQFFSEEVLPGEEELINYPQSARNMNS